MKKNFRFMETLRLKTVLTLVLEDYPEANLKWCQSQDIQFMVGHLKAGLIIAIWDPRKQGAL